MAAIHLVCLHMQRFGDPSFDLFKLPDEHNELRAVLRDLCEKEIARTPPTSTRTRGSPRRRSRLNDTGFSAVHVPEEYGGQGADAVADLHRGRGGGPGVRIVLADPGVNKLGTMGLILSGSED